jgi:hypothetical protein
MTENSTWPFPWPQSAIAQYTAYRVNTPPQIDGRLDEACWQRAPRSPRFADLITGQPAIHETRAAVLWDDDYLYVGYWVEEPFVTATQATRDGPDSSSAPYCKSQKILQLRRTSGHATRDGSFC